MIGSNRAKLLRWSCRLSTSLASTQQLSLHRLSLTQVTHFSHLAQFPPAAISTKPYFTDYKLHNFHQHLLFSSKSQSFVELVLSNDDDWSAEFENELEKLAPIELTHESVVYVLLKLRENPQNSLGFFRWVCDRKGFNPSYVHYSVLLSSLACKEFLKEFWVVAFEMKEKGVCFDYQAYQNVNERLRVENLDEDSVQWTKLWHTKTDLDNLAKEVVELVLGSDSNEKVVEVLEDRLKFQLSQNFVLRMILELSRQPLTALKFFEWVGSCRGYKHDSITYNETAKVLATKPGFVDEFWNIVKQMKSEGIEMDIDTYMKSWRHLPSVDAVELFELLMDGPYKPSSRHVTLLLRSISSGDSDPDMNLVYRVAEKFVGAGNTMTKCIYDNIHRALCKLGKFDEAKKILDELRNAGYKPDNITYSQEVFGLSKHNRLDEACKLLEQMEVDDGCVPDRKTWTLLIEGYCIAHQMDHALSCLAKMKGKGVSPDAETLHVLVWGFISENKVLGAYEILVQMVRKDHVKPRPSTCKLMIEKLAEAGNLEQAVEVFGMMKQWGYHPTPGPITTYISKCGTIDDARKFLKTISVKGSPSTGSYIRVVKSFLEEGRHLEAKCLVNESPLRVRKEIANREMFTSGDIVGTMDRLGSLNSEAGNISTMDQEIQQTHD